MRAKIRANREAYDEILCLYGDCGTGGELDRVLEEEGVSRIEGAHCYEFYAGEETFSALAEEEPGTFYLTDFLVRHFDALVIRGLGLDRFPELRDDYFGNYRRVVHLAQFDDPDLETKAKAAAERLGLAYERRFTGLDGIRAFLEGATQKKDGVVASLTILYWRDIPSQVIVKAGRSSAKRQLSERFIRAIDAAAMHAGAKSDDAYLAEWRRGEPMPCGDDLENEAEAAAAAARKRIRYASPGDSGQARRAREPGVTRELRAGRAPCVTPAKAGVQAVAKVFRTGHRALDARFRGHDKTTGQRSTE